MVPSLSLSDLSASQAGFVSKVCEGLNGQTDRAIAHIYGDRSENEAGFCFVATRLDASFEVAFDFNVGRLYRTAVQLPLRF